MLKSKPRFMTGYNAGSRHAKFGIVPPEFTMQDRTDDFKAGYKFGIIDRRAGKPTDNTAATGCINAAWDIYSKGGEVPHASL